MLGPNNGDRQNPECEWEPPKVDPDELKVPPASVLGLKSFGRAEEGLGKSPAMFVV